MKKIIKNIFFLLIMVIVIASGIYSIYKFNKSTTLKIFLLSQIPTLVGIYETLMYFLGKVNPKFRTRVGLILKGQTDITLTNMAYLEVQSYEDFENEVSDLLSRKYSLDKFNKVNNQTIHCVFSTKNLPIKASIDFQEDGVVLINFSQIFSTHKKVSDYYKNIDTIIRDIEKLKSVNSIELTTRISYTNGTNIVLEELAKTKNEASIMIKNRYFTITKKDIELRNNDSGHHIEILNQILTGQYFY